MSVNAITIDSNGLKIKSYVEIRTALAADYVFLVLKKSPYKIQTKLDQLCNANFREVHRAIESNPELLKVAALNETYALDDKKFDIAIILDAECITVAEAFSSICLANKVVLIGDPHMPAIESQPFDAYPNILPRQSAFFQENILAAALRKGIPTREIWFSNTYYDITLVGFPRAQKEPL